MGRPGVVEVTVKIEADKTRMIRIAGDDVINIKTELDI